MDEAGNPLRLSSAVPLASFGEPSWSQRAEATACNRSERAYHRAASSGSERIPITRSLRKVSGSNVRAIPLAPRASPSTAARPNNSRAAARSPRASAASPLVTRESRSTELGTLLRVEGGSTARVCSSGELRSAGSFKSVRTISISGTMPKGGSAWVIKGLSRAGVALSLKVVLRSRMPSRIAASRTGPEEVVLVEKKSADRSPRRRRSPPVQLTH